MKNISGKIISVLIATMLFSSLTACGQSKEENIPDNNVIEETTDSTTSEENLAEVANPMVESDYESIVELTGCNIIIPENAEDPKFFIINNEMGEIQYTTENGFTNMTFRMAKSEEFKDISGMNYSWDYEEDYDIYGFPCKVYGYNGDEEDIQVCNWWDNVNNVMYSLSAVANDLDGFDILGAANTTLAFDAPLGDYPSNEFEVRVGKTSFESYDEIISLLEGDEAYALVKVRGYDGEVLMVTEGTYDNLDGNMAAIDATPYTKKANGSVTADSALYSPSTATPISMDEEGNIYCYGHSTAEVCCYGTNGTENVSLMIVNSVDIDEYDDNGDPLKIGGFYRTNNDIVNDDIVWYDENDTDAFYKAFELYEKTTPINFTPCK